MTESKRARLLVVGNIASEVLRILGESYELVRDQDLPPGPLPGFDIALTNSMFGADAALMDSLPDLRFIACQGVGLDQIDLPEARRRGIVVCHTPDSVTRDTADFAIALMFAAARRLAEADRFVRSGQWAGQRFAPTRRVSGKRMGVVGLGKIGGLIAQRGAGLDLEVAYCTRTPRPEQPYPHFASVPELAGWADYLVMACPGGSETRHLVNAEVLERLGPQGFLINVARGSVVDETALIAALRAKTIAGAGLDVFENEPNIDPALLELDNLVLTAHVAAQTYETQADIAGHLRSGIDAFLAARAGV
ncbi:MAG TPA: 2-hydroxyacid dehydrogenase [Caulobacteraceae bacterium]|jgi:lactate dehydrogenase-like 2-hydroxyacid dehydrogenase|nr:2-hydroxyacid dehydrogenase [Caulobacteraceae bacterium]